MRSRISKSVWFFTVLAVLLSATVISDAIAQGEPPILEDPGALKELRLAFEIEDAKVSGQLLELNRNYERKLKELIAAASRPEDRVEVEKELKGFRVGEGVENPKFYDLRQVTGLYQSHRRRIETSIAPQRRPLLEDYLQKLLPEFEATGEAAKSRWLRELVRISNQIHPSPPEEPFTFELAGERVKGRSLVLIHAGNWPEPKLAFDSLPEGLAFQVIIVDADRARFVTQRALPNPDGAPRYQSYKIYQVQAMSGGIFDWRSAWDHDAELYYPNAFSPADLSAPLPRAPFFPVMEWSRAWLAGAIPTRDAGVGIETDWRWPLELAYQLNPDLIFLSGENATLPYQRGINQQELRDYFVDRYQKSGTTAKIYGFPRTFTSGVIRIDYLSQLVDESGGKMIRR